MWPAELHFLRPHWLWLLLPLGWLAWRLATGGGDAQVWRRVVDAKLLAHLLSDAQGGRRRLPIVLLAVAWLLAVIALAGPTWERLPQPVYQAQQHRVILLDLSPTMNATDLPPSRLARARFEVLDILRRSQDGQTALIAYGAEPFIVAPLTGDTETIAVQVPSLETALLPVGGARRTDLALEEAGRLLEQAGARDGDIIVVTDGITSPAAAGESSRRLAERGYRVSVLGVGTDAGSPVPAPDGGFVKDAQGAILVPRLDPPQLAAVAGAGGGRFAVAAAGDADLDALLPVTSVAMADDVEQSDAQTDQWREAGPWLLLLLLPLAALAFRRGWISPLLLLVFLLPPPDAHALGWVDLWANPDQRAMQRFAAGDPASAAQLFERDDWRAAAAYAAGDYDTALATLEQAEGPVAAYNRGNALARLGRLEDAVSVYDQVLQRDPGHADARYNRDLVQALIDQRRAQQSQQDNASSEPSQADDGQPQGDASQAAQSTEAGGKTASDGEPSDQGEPDDGSDAAQARQGGEQAGGNRDDSAKGQHGGDAGEDGESAAGAAGTADRNDAGDGQSGDRQGEDAGAAAGAVAETGSEDRQGGDEAAQSGDVQPQADGEDGPTRQAEAAGGQGDLSERGDQADGSQLDGGDAQGQRGPGDDAGSQSSAGTAPGGPQPGRADPQDGQQQAAGGPAAPSASNEPGMADLLGQPPGARTRLGEAELPRLDAEGRQAVQQMLRRVDDDPSGLLRQRFMLQHLRRQGRLP